MVLEMAKTERKSGISGYHLAFTQELKHRSFIDFERIFCYTIFIATQRVGDVNSRRNHGDAVRVTAAGRPPG